MKLEALHEKLIAAARAHPPSDRVPYAFEKRIMARITGAPPPDMIACWAAALWRAAASCVALTVVCGGLALWLAPSGTGTDLSGELESAVFAMADNDVR